MTAPRWLGSALLVLAAVLVPWIGLLAAFNPSTAAAFHVHLATLGHGAASSAAAAVAAAAVARGRLWAAPAAIACATLAGAGAVGVLVTTEAAWTRVALLGLACAAVAAVSAHLLLRAARDGRRLPHRRVAAALGAVAVALAAQTAFFVAEQPRSFTAHHVRLAWVWLDLAELACLGGAGLAVRRGHAVRAVVAGSAGASLLLMDAWVNVTLAPGGSALAWAIVFAAVAEVPSAALCGWAAHAGVAGLRSLRVSAAPPGGSPHVRKGACTTAPAPAPCDAGTTRSEEPR